MAWEETLRDFGNSGKPKKKKFDLEFLKKHMDSDGYGVNAMILALHLMSVGDMFVAATGKITKTGIGKFELSVDNDVIEKGVEVIYEDHSDPISAIFRNQE